MKTLMTKKIERNFLTEINDSLFNTVTYSIFNKIDEDMFVYKMNKLYDEIFSVDDFEYFDFDFTDKEKFLMKMRNKEFLKGIKNTKKILEQIEGVVVHTLYDEGIVRVVKLKNVNLNDGLRL